MLTALRLAALLLIAISASSTMALPAPVTPMKPPNRLANRAIPYKRGIAAVLKQWNPRAVKVANQKRNNWGPSPTTTGPSRTWGPSKTWTPFTSIPGTPTTTWASHQPSRLYGAGAQATGTAAKSALYGDDAAQVCNTIQIPGAEITACPADNGWECINTASSLESCGGCASLGQGMDCTAIPGVASVGCIFSKCVVGSCETGYTLNSGVCVPGTF